MNPHQMQSFLINSIRRNVVDSNSTSNRGSPPMIPFSQNPNGRIEMRQHPPPANYSLAPIHFAKGGHPPLQPIVNNPFGGSPAGEHHSGTSGTPPPANHPSGRPAPPSASARSSHSFSPPSLASVDPFSAGSSNELWAAVQRQIVNDERLSFTARGMYYSNQRFNREDVDRILGSSDTFFVRGDERPVVEESVNMRITWHTVRVAEVEYVRRSTQPSEQSDPDVDMKPDLSNRTLDPVDVRAFAMTAPAPGDGASISNPSEVSERNLTVSNNAEHGDDDRVRDDERRGGAEKQSGDERIQRKRQLEEEGGEQSAVGNKKDRVEVGETNAQSEHPVDQPRHFALKQVEEEVVEGEEGAEEVPIVGSYDGVPQMNAPVLDQGDGKAQCQQPSDSNLMFPNVAEGGRNEGLRDEERRDAEKSGSPEQHRSGTLESIKVECVEEDDGEYGSEHRQ